MELHLKGVSKTYPNGTQALNDLSLHLTNGMFGLLGPNGAGKSTLMRTIATLQQPDAGTIRYGDIDVLANPLALRKTLGYLPQEFGVYPRISADRLLDYLARLKGLSDRKERQRMIEYCLEVTNLTAHRRTAVSSYSGGMKQRFGIAQLLLNTPGLIIVDEPTAGLDPAERQRFLNILRAISTESIVIFSTHIVEDIADLCTDMAVMNHGNLLLHNTPERAISDLTGRVWMTNIIASDLPEYQARCQVLSSAFNRDNSLRVRVLAEDVPTGFTPSPPSLEDVYFAAMRGHYCTVT
jgi:ABC-type multidrug transport system ATPase subunit